MPTTRQKSSSPTHTVIPLTKRQCKHKRAKDTKLAKKFTNLNSEINALKLQMEELKEKISRTSKSAHSGFKRKKIRTMKREVNKVSAALEKSEAHLKSMRVPKDPVSGVPLKLHPRSRPKRREVKIAELNKKIRTVTIAVSTEELHTLDATCSIRYHPIFLSYSIISQDTMHICS